MKYIGKHKSKQYDINYLGSGLLMQKALVKYNRECFDNYVLEYVNTEKQLNKREEYWINYFNADTEKDFYNIAKGGNNFGYVNGNFNLNNPHTYKKWKLAMAKIRDSEEIKLKKSLAMRGKLAGDKNPSKRPENARKISIGKKKAYARLSNEDKQQIIDRLKSYLQKFDKKKLAENTSKRFKGTIVLTKFIKGKKHIKRCKPEEVSKLVKDGWCKGNLGGTTKGKVVVTKFNHLKYIDPKDIKLYLKEGYVLGAKLENDKRIGIEPKNKGKICITNGINNKYINKEDLDKYLQLGYIKGRLRGGKIQIKHN